MGVYQFLKNHFSRYTPEMVERYCGVPKELFLKLAETYCSASGPEKTGVICYAVGWTQHSRGVQMIRAAAILQLLLGNIGRPGGGILALRGHASIQGSTDIPTLYDILPGYLLMPTRGSDARTLSDYIEKHRASTGWWANYDKYIVSLLKAYYGDAATVNNDYGFQWLPRVTRDHSHQGYWLDMMDGKMEGLFVMGQNPAVAGPNARLERRALARLKWLVVRDMVELETASFWSNSPEVKRGELRTEEIATEVFFLPAAAHVRRARFHQKEAAELRTARERRWRRGPRWRQAFCHASGRSRLDLGLRRTEGRTSTSALRALESPIRNPLYRQQTDPAADAKVRPDNAYANSPDARFPCVLSTYRLTEHHTAGGMSRMLPHLSELQPELFCEISPELAAERGINHGGWVTVVTVRGSVVARALVTPRIQPPRIDGRVLHQVGLPYHWGYCGLVKGDVVNDLIAISEEPNVRIMETKGVLCNVLPERQAE